jgi:hypothetical protein
MDKMDAIYTHNNAYDTIVLSNGGAMTVTKGVFVDFINPDTGNSIQYWDGDEHWDGMQAESITITEAAEAYGEIIACYENGKLIVVDFLLWKERKEFYLGEENNNAIFSMCV